MNGAARIEPEGSGEIVATLRSLLSEVLGLDEARVASFGEDTELFGALPEFDSMAVANLLTGLEERLAVLIEDDDVEAEDFATFGKLKSFAERLALR
jgi:acyl carrier protein